MNKLVETQPGSWILVTGSRTIPTTMQLFITRLAERGLVHVLDGGDRFNVSSAARIVSQIRADGKLVSPGQCVRFLFTRVNPGVRPWYATEPTDISRVDSLRYRTFSLRAVNAVVEHTQQRFEIMPVETTYSLFLLKKAESLAESSYQKSANPKIAPVSDFHNNAMGL